MTSHRNSDSGEEIINWRWGYALLTLKTLVMFVDGGISKSFGVLIQEMVFRSRGSNYAIVGFICTLPGTLMYLCSPLVITVIKFMDRRLVAVIGAVTSSLCIIVCAFSTDVAIIGLSLALTGTGIACVYMTTMLSLNDFFPKTFIVLNTLSLYGYTAGTVVVPFIIERSFEGYGYSGAFLIMAAFTSNIIASAAGIRKPILRKSSTAKKHPKTPEITPHQPDRSPLIQENALPHENDNSSDQSNANEENRTESSGWIALVTKETFFMYNLPTVFFFAYTIHSWMLFLVPHAEQLGIRKSNAVFLSSLAGIGGLFGRTVFIVLIGKNVSAFHIYTVAGVFNTTSFLLDFLGLGFPTRAGLAFVQGFAFFTEDSMFLSFAKETVVNPDNFGQALSLVSFVYGIGASFAGYLTGHLFDVIGSYTKVFIIIGIMHGFVTVQLCITSIYLKIRRRTN